MKKPKHSADFLFGNSLKAEEKSRELTQGKVLCEGCIEELAAKIDEGYKYRWLLAKAEKKLANQRKQLKQFRARWKELREVLRNSEMPDIGKETNIVQYFAGWRSDGIC